EISYYRVIKGLRVCQDYCVRKAANHTICFAYCNPLVIDSPQLCCLRIYTIGCYSYDFCFFLLLLFFCQIYSQFWEKPMTKRKTGNWKPTFAKISEHLLYLISIQ